jgi:hypothetical protein
MAGADDSGGGDDLAWASACPAGLAGRVAAGAAVVLAG